VEDHERLRQFEEKIMPHLDAAYNLARWLAGNDHDAADVAQEASLRAFKYFGNFRGESPRAWLLTIVRNTFYNLLHKNDRSEISSLDEAIAVEDVTVNPDVLNSRLSDSEAIHRAIAALPVEFREAVILREMEGLSYKEIADISGVPIGTVMSRIARARRQLQKDLTHELRPGSRT
jgi:RNA polymerase sigma-70 factor (ECF subfamily)